MSEHHDTELYWKLFGGAALGVCFVFWVLYARWACVRSYMFETWLEDQTDSLEQLNLERLRLLTYLVYAEQHDEKTASLSSQETGQLMGLSPKYPRDQLSPRASCTTAATGASSPEKQSSPPEDRRISFNPEKTESDSPKKDGQVRERKISTKPEAPSPEKALSPPQHRKKSSKASPEKQSPARDRKLSSKLHVVLGIDPKFAEAIQNRMSRKRTRKESRADDVSRDASETTDRHFPKPDDTLALLMEPENQEAAKMLLDEIREFFKDYRAESTTSFELKAQAQKAASDLCQKEQKPVEVEQV